jgi:hypothetical protein
MKLKNIFIPFAIFLTGCANTGSNSLSESFEKYSDSENVDAPYLYSGIYFAKNSGNFPVDFDKCNNSYIEYIKSNSQGYKVARSMGKTDQDIISKGVKDCLFVNDWSLYKLEGNELKEIMFGHLSYKTKDMMSEEEIQESLDTLEKRKQWYKKYQPTLIN